MKTREMERSGVRFGWRYASVLALCGLVFGAWAQTPEGEPPTRVLLKALFRLSVSDQIASQAATFASRADEVAAVEIEMAVDSFKAEISERIRTELDEIFGTVARDEFGVFVDRYATAEAEKDLEFLGRLVAMSGEWKQKPETFDQIRQAMVQDVMKDEIAEGSRFLAEIQTWLDVRKKAQDVPNLEVWLKREDSVQSVIAQTPKSTRKANPLRDAEAKAKTFEGGDDGEASVLAGFGAARAERRQKALEDARAGMQQVAEERRVAEDEAASKKLAAAQAESEAVRKHAEKLAASESEAIEQRRNSWSSRLKSVLSTTIGATSGAFLGNVGSRAGEAAADAVFNTDSGHRR